MKRRAEREPTAMAGEAEEHEETREGEAEEGEEDADLNCREGSDICQALMDRYAKSSAPQHRHLCASAAAMRSILQEEGLPLTPPAYFAAAFTAVRDSARADTSATAALASFLSILLPLLPAGSLPPTKAKDAAFVLAAFLRDPPSGLATGTARSLVKSLGLLVLRVDLEDWGAVELPLETLLAFAVDRRPKVRRCAQLCVEKVFRTLKNSDVVKKASKVVACMYKKYIPLAKELSSMELSDAPKSKKLPIPEHMELLHMLNVLTLLIPNLSKKIKIKIFSDAYKLLGCRFSLLTRHTLKLIDALLRHSEVKVLISESENISSALTSYVSSNEKNPVDTIFAASTLSKIVLNKLHDAQPNMWIRCLPPIFTSVAGYLGSDANTSKDAAHVLKELINLNIDRRIFLTNASQSCNFEKESSPEAAAVISISSLFSDLLSTCDVPTEYMLAVISVLFLSLGEFSYNFMKEVLLKLSHWAINVDKELQTAKHLQECIGAAIIAMGPEKVLSLIPITFDKEKLTCSNTWLIPILKKYVVGSSLQFFMEHIVPLAESLQNACDKVKKASKQKNLKSCVHGLWDLLPAFCHYPTDTYHNFKILAKLLMVVLKEDPSLHEVIAVALQELVNENRSIVQTSQDDNQHGDLSTSLILENLHVESRFSPFHYSRKTASKNIKALTSSSVDLVETIADVFFDSPPEKRAYLKETIGCLAFLVGSESIHSLFLSLLEKFDLVGSLVESKELEDPSQDADKKEEVEESANKEKHKENRCLVMELVSSFVEAADKDLINIFFDFVRSSLLVCDERCQREAYFTLSKILKGHSWFCSARVNELIDLFNSIKAPADSMALKNRLSCYHFLLVHMLKRNEENMNTKAFLILNEIILTLKTKKESRKLAYDVLLTISGSLKNPQSGDAESDLQRLISMVMGYLSSSSPHIISGAISALSLLIYNDADFCLAVPNLLPSVLVLLQNKDIEVTKAALGFVKVLVSSLQTDKLLKLVPNVVNGILPWSSVSKHHFKSKVAVILEIFIRKCGFDAIDIIVPKNCKAFVKTIKEGRRSKKNPKRVARSETAVKSADSVTKGGKKRVLGDVTGSQEKNSRATTKDQKGRRKKQRKDILSMNETCQTAGRNQLTNGANPSNSESLLEARSRENKKRNVIDRPKWRNRATGDHRRDDKKPKHAPAHSKFDPSAKSNKRKMSGNPRGVK
ncbi:RRP12-like protein isoform X1 [Phoenix dactylifera]|uniref:RRP12-like protein isoform X1 n=1 Tax=Phoenix dactylifera TaxID=42345 RepID=A0A8B7CZ56_PHODC|nr:RRP12-like protein isoform X1 [Phoenix dactylifera]